MSNDPSWVNATRERIMDDLRLIARSMWEAQVDESRRRRGLMLSTSPLALWQVFRRA